MEQEIMNVITHGSWDEHYASIHCNCIRNNVFPHKFASLPENISLNRYRDVYPYDHSRVILECDQQPKPGCHGNYINASLVTVPRASRSYILAQGPLALTVGHFWLMVWQQGSRAVVMLNRLVEKGQTKCHQYWPDSYDDATLELNDVGLHLQNVGCLPGKHYTTRQLVLTHLNSGQSRQLTHFHYTTWPDFGVPTCPDTFLEFLQIVRDSGSLDDSSHPAVVHCSAGIGRSGTFCLVDSCLVLIDLLGADNVSVHDVLMEMRKCRMGLIQTASQLKFSYASIVQGAIEKAQMDQSSLSVFGMVRSVDVYEEDQEANITPPPPVRSESLQSGEHVAYSEEFSSYDFELRRRQKKSSLNMKVQAMKKKSQESIMKEKMEAEKTASAKFLRYLIDLTPCSVSFFVGISLIAFGGYLYAFSWGANNQSL